ncbi:MAG: hypothetical protein HY040_03660 [Planctomycetes bacterium]|nr:hypothetical protein [Planctomycetota bacterium]
MRALSSILGVALLSLFIGCGGPSDVDSINKELDALNDKMGAINRQTTVIAERIKAVEKLKGDFDALETRISALAADKQDALRARLKNVQDRINRKD